MIMPWQSGILKQEFGLAEQLNNLKEAEQQVKESITIYNQLLYNQLRPHVSCQMLTRQNMHRQQNKG